MQPGMRKQSIRFVSWVVISVYRVIFIPCNQMIMPTFTWYTNSGCKLTGKVKRTKYIDMEQFVDNDHSSHDVFLIVSLKFSISIYSCTSISQKLIQRM